MGKELLLPLGLLSAAPVGDHDEQARVKADHRLDRLATKGAHHWLRHWVSAPEWAVRDSGETRSNTRAVGPTPVGGA